MSENTEANQLIAQLGNRNVALKEHAQKQLFAMGENALPHLANALKNGEPRIAANVVNVLKTFINDPDTSIDVLDHLVFALDHEYFMVRENAANALADMADPRAIEPLIQHLKDEHRAVRVQVVQALGAIGDKRAIPPLVDLLQTTDYPVMIYTIIRALIKLDAQETLDVIVQFEDYPEHHVRDDVARAREKFGNK